MSADQVFSAFRCACSYCMVQAEGAYDPSHAWRQSYYVPDPPKIPAPPGAVSNTAPPPPPPEPGWTGPRFYTLLRGDDWNDPQVGIPWRIPYTFATRAMSNYSTGPDDPARSGFENTSGQPLSEVQRANIRHALELWEQVSGITFVEVADSKAWNFDGIRFMMESVDEYGLLGASIPHDGPYGFNIAINRLSYGAAALDPGTYGFWTALHEIGHAIGLKHPFDGDPTLRKSEDNNINTVMSYTDRGNLSQLGPYDIAAVQHIYGVPELKATMPFRWSEGPRGAMVTTANDFANVITGISVRDVVWALGGDDLIATGDGDDYVAPGVGNDAVYGGGGVDTLYTAMLRRSAAVELGVGQDGSVQGTVNLPDGRDSFYSVENLGFIDGTLAIANDSVAAQVYRLYDAAFARAPDAIGLGAWTDAVQSGSVSLSAAASQFVNSPEFVVKYGALGDSAFVSRLYENVFGRAADVGGLSHWTRALQSGASRGDVLVGFSESAEAHKETAETFAKGVWAVNPDAADVVRGYVAVLDRSPDAGGLVHWTMALENGYSQPELIALLASSPEFQARFGGLSNRDFVEQLYRAALDRPGDLEGVAAWTHVLDAGIDTRAGVALGFAGSPEMTAKVTPMVAGGLWFV